MHRRDLDQDLSALFAAQRLKVSAMLYQPPTPRARPTVVAPTKALGSMVVLTTRTATGSKRHLDVEMPTDLTREMF